MTDRITASTQKVGLLGWPVEHSFSPRMHNAAFREANLDWVYLPLPVEPTAGAIEKALQGLSALGFRGANVTIPYKQNVLPYLSEASGTVRSVGAVNTLRIGSDAALAGDNTDVYGFLAPLQALAGSLQGRRALLLGAGGAARSVAYGLAQAGCIHLTVYNRTVARAKQLQTGLAPCLPPMEWRILTRPEQVSAAAAEVSLVVNSTSVGMFPHVASSPVPEDFPWHSSLIAYDLVYNPRETRFLAQARARGATCINGLEMLLFQGARSFEIWTGQTPPLETMRSQLYQHFAE